MKINYYPVESPFGWFYLIFDERNLHSIKYGLLPSELNKMHKVEEESCPLSLIK